MKKRGLAQRSRAEERPSVYSEGYFARLLESLSDDFRALRRAVSMRSGEQSFACLVADYLAGNPSRDVCLQSLGAGLPAFLCRHPETADLAELALLEWKVMESFYADNTGSPRGTCPVSEASAEALAARGQPLHQLLQATCDTICNSVGDILPEEIQSWTARWVNERILRGVRSE